MASKTMIISITGPECSGKTTLTQSLATYYDTTWIPEFAREYLEELGRSYDQGDILHIASEHIKRVHEASKTRPSVVLMDTGLLVLVIWSQYKYRYVDPRLGQLYCENQPDAYILCRPDIPWEEDVLRENQGERDILFHLYLSELERTNIPYRIVDGSVNRRLELATDFISTQMVRYPTE